jgi:GTP-binding protein
LHLIDITQDDPAAAYKMLRNELKQYGGGLYEKPEIIALNKADALGHDLAEDVRKTFAKKTRKKPFVISGVSGEGIPDVTKALADIIFSKDE